LDCGGWLLSQKCCRQEAEYKETPAEYSDMHVRYFMDSGFGHEDFLLLAQDYRYSVMLSFSDDDCRIEVEQVLQISPMLRDDGNEVSS
jgi:hypothetical protein